MSRTLKYEIPGDDPRRAMIDVVESGFAAIFEPGPVRASVEAHQMVLEIGFGRGEFLLDLAHKRPNTAFVGIEISFKRVLKMARKVARAGLSNVRLFEGRAEVAIRDLFEPGSLAEVWVNFSDPWPKARHAHRRVIQTAFAKSAARALAPGGTLFIATDDVPYAHQIDEVLSTCDALENRYAPWPFLPEVGSRTRTGYEEQWRAEGRPMHFFAYGPRSVDSQVAA